MPALVEPQFAAKGYAMFALLAHTAVIRSSHLLWAFVESRILKFCKPFENLYGTEKCAPNMHLSCHLVECIGD